MSIVLICTQADPVYAQSKVLFRKNSRSWAPYSVVDMTRSLHTHIILWLWIMAAAAAQNTTAETTCYYPNGQPSPDVPCFANANVSMCCPEGSECLSDGTCGLDVSAIPTSSTFVLLN